MTAPSAALTREQELHSIAIHESGHVVVGVLVGSRLGEVRVAEPGRGLKSVAVVHRPPRARDCVVIQLAGAGAEVLRDRLRLTFAEALVRYAEVAGTDFRRARGACADDEELLEEMWWRVLGMLTSNWPAVEALAAELVERGTVSGEAARRIVRRALPPRPSPPGRRWGYELPVRQRDGPAVEPPPAR